MPWPCKSGGKFHRNLRGFVAPDFLWAAAATECSECRFSATLILVHMANLSVEVRGRASARMVAVEPSRPKAPVSQNGALRRRHDFGRRSLRVSRVEQRGAIFAGLLNRIVKCRGFCATGKRPLSRSQTGTGLAAQLPRLLLAARARLVRTELLWYRNRLRLDGETSRSPHVLPARRST